MALACETAGVAKAGRDVLALVILGLLAGAFIAFGDLFLTVVLTGAGALPWAVARLLAGLVFSFLLAGAFIAFGAIFMTVVLCGAGELPGGVARLLAGMVLSLGLIWVI